jgi:hypothetical protein
MGINLCVKKPGSVVLIINGGIFLWYFIFYKKYKSV